MIDHTYNFIVKVTTACPGNCRCCTNRQINFKDKSNGSAFDIDVFRAICKKLSEIGGRYICLSGGEPTFVDNLEDYVSVAHEFNLVSRLNTNGWNLTETRLKTFLDLGLDQIVLSIYGTDEDQILKTRGNARIYGRSMEALSAITKLKETYTFSFIIQTVIMRDTFRQIPQILKMAFNHKANRFWPSYLEDSINLQDLRLTKEDVKIFREHVIPEMVDIIEKANLDATVRGRIIKDVRKIYEKDYSNGVYHPNGIECPWPGHHMTFYPNGIVDPCPGHEYFKSDDQIIADYGDVDSLLNEDNLRKLIDKRFEYCRYCPHGVHVDIPLGKEIVHEHLAQSTQELD